MLTKVILEGPMGKEFGREWAFAINSPREALSMVNANKPGVFNWIRANLQKYATYRVVCEYEDGRVEELDKDAYMLKGRPALIRFVPLVEGASDVVRTIVGAILVVVGVVYEQPWMVNIGASMMIGGVIEMLSPRPKMDERNGAEGEGKSSYYFNGPANTTNQGVPVQLVYGRMLVGSHAISAAVTVDQLM